MSENRITAALVGAAVGDALGSPVRGMKPGHIVQKFGRISDYPDPEKAYRDNLYHWRPRGLYSHITQQILAVTESLVTIGSYDPDDIAEHFLSLYGSGENEGLFRGRSFTLYKSLRSLQEGTSLLECGRPEPGMEALPRLIPVAIYLSGERDILRKAVIELTLFTHNDPRAVGAGIAFAEVISSLVENPEQVMKYPEEFLSELAKDVRRGEEYLQDEYGSYLSGDIPDDVWYVMSDALPVLIPCLKEDNADLVKKTILAEANRTKPMFPVSVVTQDYAPSGVSFFLYQLFTSTAFGPALLDVIHCGKESTIAGASAGGLLGVRLGMESIPPEWIEGLVNEDQIRLRGRELSSGFADWSVRTDLASLERKWTEKENRRRRREHEKYEREKEKKQKKSSPPKKEKSEESIDQEKAPFAPPPHVVFDDELPDPIKAKKQKAIRGRKRIKWKEERRKKKRRKDKE